jgi:hypothetical protein
MKLGVMRKFYINLRILFRGINGILVLIMNEYYLLISIEWRSLLALQAMTADCLDEGGAAVVLDSRGSH